MQKEELNVKNVIYVAMPTAYRSSKEIEESKRKIENILPSLFDEEFEVVYPSEIENVSYKVCDENQHFEKRTPREMAENIMDLASATTFVYFSEIVYNLDDLKLYLHAAESFRMNIVRLPIRCIMSQLDSNIYPRLISDNRGDCSCEALE